MRRKRTVFGLGHENGSSSVGYCPEGESAKPLHSGESFCTKRKVRGDIYIDFHFYNDEEIYEISAEKKVALKS